MTDRFGGRVLAGEDSEEDEEEEEELGFHLGGARGAPLVVQPKFSVQAPTAGAEDGESDDEGEGEGGFASGKADAAPNDGGESPAPVETTLTPERTPRVSIDSTSRSISRPTTPELPLGKHAESQPAAYDADWSTDGSVDGMAMMGQSIMQKLQPSLDSTIRRIAELTDSQQRLLTLLNDQHREIVANDQIENVAIVMGKLPQYIKKVQNIKASMAEVSLSVERMKKRSESLRVDAQSHAIKKENKRESQNQWNKLYAAKSYEGTTMTGGFPAAQPPPPPPPAST